MVGGEGEYLLIEDGVRLLVELRCISIEAEDPTFNHSLILHERQLVDHLIPAIAAFVEHSTLFKMIEPKDDLYFEECEFASYLRCLKLLKKEEVIYEKLQNIIIRPSLS